jgi:hypothetical protein
VPSIPTAVIHSTLLLRLDNELAKDVASDVLFALRLAGYRFSVNRPWARVRATDTMARTIRS